MRGCCGGLYNVVMELITTEKVMKDIILSQRHKENEPSFVKLKTNGSLDLRYKLTQQLIREEFKKKMLHENRRHNKIIYSNEGNYRKEILDLDESDISIFRNTKN